MVPFEQLHFVNRIARLGPPFVEAVKPQPLQAAFLGSFNARAAELLGLDAAVAAHPDFVAIINGEKSVPHFAPVAMRYSGHQFGHYVPQLGDGRAMVLGEVAAPSGHWELQLKGSGLTPFSRMGDGRAVLRSTIREYLCSEAMAGLGIPTTRALCMLGSSEEVYREQIEQGALLVRMAPSHLRFGSFEIFFHNQQFDALQTLADFVLQHHYPELREADQPYLALLDAVIARTARLLAQWQLVGFAHGVMNSDNMSVLGLTIDYGPFGFLDAYDPHFICNHSDHHGRYAFDQQPRIGLWNLHCFANAVLPLLDSEDADVAVEKARVALARYDALFAEAFQSGMRAKLGLQQVLPDDERLMRDLLDRLAANRVDYTLFFRRLSQYSPTDAASAMALRDLFLDRASCDAWLASYNVRLAMENATDAVRQQAMCSVNPRYVLRNYMAQIAIEKAEAGDFSEVERLLRLVQDPFNEHPDSQHYAGHPPAWADKISVSCSS